MTQVNDNEAEGMLAADPLDEQRWHVWVDGGDQVGPVSVRQIARGIRAGVVPPEARVQQTGDVWWSGILDEPKVVEALKSA
ncbi:MAG: hypothetical protein SFV15_11880 [Polyangiaceae bacterium]|nr:hypothetical protein [Polyangiaceae bacterium]